MQTWLAIARAIDRLNSGVGRLIRGFALLMVLVGAFNALARYAGRFTGLRLSSNAFIETQWYLFSLLFLLGAGYAYLHDRHVRVDVLHSRLGPRARAGIELAGNALLLLPFCVLLVVVSLPAVSSSISVREVSPDPGGLPRYPLKAAMLLAFALLALQSVSQAIKSVAVLCGRPVALFGGEGAA